MSNVRPDPAAFLDRVDREIDCGGGDGKHGP